MKNLKLCPSIFLIAAAVAILSGCAVHNTLTPPLTQLQIRETQSREFETNNTKLVMKSMVNVLQDEGFIVKNAVVDLGLLSAEKSIDVENPAAATCMKILAGSNARWDKHQILEASANVSEFGVKTRVRINFQTKTMDNFGCPKEIETLTDLQYYQDFFDKVSKAIFIQEQNI